MGQFKRSVTVKCPIDKTFDYVTDWQNFKSFLSIIVDISPSTYVQYGPGAAYDTKFKAGGANIQTTLEVTEYKRPMRLLVRSRSGVKMQGGWEFKSSTGGTVIQFSLSYDLPPGLVRSPQDKILVEKEFEDGAVQSLQLLKWILESSTLADKEEH